MKTITIISIIFFLHINYIFSAESIQIELAKKVALYYGAERFESVSIYDSKIFSDPVEGTPQAVVFTLYLGDGVHPSIRETLEKVKQGYDDKSNLIEKIKQARETGNIDEINQLHSEYENSINLKNQSDLFATIVVGANNEMQPFIARKTGLPDYWTNYYKYQKMIEKKTGVDKAVPINYYWLGPTLYGYEFQVNNKNYLSTNNYDVILKSDLQKKTDYTSKDRQRIKANRSKAKQNWIKILGFDEIMRININGIYHSSQNRSSRDEGYIDGVPSFYQDYFGGPGSTICGPVSGAQLLGYWNNNGYPNLINWGVADQYENYDGVSNLIEDLKITMDWSSGGTSWLDMGPGILEVCNDSEYNNNLEFEANTDWWVWWSTCKDEIDSSRPFLYLINGYFETPGGYSLSMNHATTAIGYEEQYSPFELNIIFVNGNYDNMENFEINFDSVDDHDIVRVYPNGSDEIIPTCEIMSPNNGGTYSGVIAVSADAYDASGVWEYQFQYSTNHNNWIDFATAIGGDFVPVVYFNSYDIEYDASVWVRAKAKDQWGNWSSWDECNQPFIVNNEGPSPTSIAATAYLNPSYTTPNSAVTVSGGAIYNTDNPVTAGTVEIYTSENSWTASLDGNGNYSRTIYAPNSSGYVSVYVSDGSLTGSTQAFLTIDGGGSGDGYDYEYSGIFTSDIDLVGDDPPVPDYFTHWISSDVEVVRMYTLLTDLYEPVRVKYEWYKPDGSQYNDLVFDWTNDPNDYGYNYYYWWNFYWGYTVEGTTHADTEGRFNVEVHIKEEGGNYEYIDSDWYVVSYDFQEHRMCQDVQDDDPWFPINPTNTFYQTDERAITWSRYTDVSESIEVKTEWYEPNGSLFSDSEYIMDGPNEGYYYSEKLQWTWKNINGNTIANKCGNWLLKKYELDPWGNWDLLYEDNFEILESPNVAPVVDVNISPNNPLENENVTLEINATDNTYLVEVILYWNDGTLHNEEWDEIYSGSLNQSENIGSFNEGETIEIYGRAFDTSGNQNETSHTYITIGDSDTEGPVFNEITITEENGNGNGIIEEGELIRINCDVQDESGIGEVHIFVDDIAVELTGEYYSIIGPFELGFHSVYISATDNDNSPATSSLQLSFEVIPSDVYGCTDEFAINYDPNATIDDGNCDFGILDINFGEITGNELKIVVSSPQPIYGFQFTILDDNSAFIVDTVYGGQVENYNFELFSGPTNVILGFSMEDNPIQSGDYEFLNIEYDLTTTTEICFSNVTFNSENSQGIYEINTNIGDCINITGPTQLSFGNISNNIIEILMLNPLPIYGFQFNLDGLSENIEIINIFGGNAEEFGMDIFFDNESGLILSFSIEGNFIPAFEENQNLINIEVSGCTETELCINDIVVSSEGGVSVNTIAGECSAFEGYNLSGDVNLDFLVNVVDIVNVVNHILGESLLSNSCAISNADLNLDNDINVVDIVLIVNNILDNFSLTLMPSITEARLFFGNNQMEIIADGDIAGV